MKKIKEFFMNKKVLGLIIVVIIVISLIVLGLNNTGSAKNKIEASLREMGTDFYENFYYENSGENANDRINAVKVFKEIGIKVSLDNLQRYNMSKKVEIKEFINPKTKEKCDIEKTRVIIYPKEEFGKKDYDLKVEVVCGFTE